VVEHLADGHAMMYLGKPVETGPAEDVFADPRHPYTAALLSATPVADPFHEKRASAWRANCPSPLDPPKGCAFNPRCPVAMPACRAELPRLVDGGNGRRIACLHETGAAA
jgi:dipeptide transport system ATP-binding protein